MSYIVGLTGGIGSGKSAAADLFAEKGIVVVDADAIAHSVTGPGHPALEQIRAAFGAEYVIPGGGMDRVRMRQRVFSDAEAKRRLEEILHPIIRQEVRTRLAEVSSPYVILMVPLLLETGAYRDIIRRLVVVDCSEETQVRRTIARSKLTRQEVLAIMANQIDRASRLSQADDVLSNDDGLEELGRRVEALHRRYLALAEEMQPPAVG